MQLLIGMFLGGGLMFLLLSFGIVGTGMIAGLIFGVWLTIQVMRWWDRVTGRKRARELQRELNHELERRRQSGHSARYQQMSGRGW